MVACAQQMGERATTQRFARYERCAQGYHGDETEEHKNVAAKHRAVTKKMTDVMVGSSIFLKSSGTKPNLYSQNVLD